jgi:hypothetical protein
MLLNMTHSDALAEFVKTEGDHSETCDMTSTAGHDNDGSTGPELIDNGVGLALAAREYDPDATIFFAVCPCCGDMCYYQYGKDEEDAIRRLREKTDTDILVEGHEDLTPEDMADGDHKYLRVWGTVGEEPFSCNVTPFSGEYDYDEYPEALLGDDDEELQKAIGQYFVDNNVDVGRIGR